MSYYFFYQLYERDYALFTNVENDNQHASINAFHATHLSHKLENHLALTYSTPHSTVVIIALHLVCKLE